MWTISEIAKQLKIKNMLPSFWQLFFLGGVLYGSEGIIPILNTIYFGYWLLMMKIIH